MGNYISSNLQKSSRRGQTCRSEFQEISEKEFEWSHKFCKTTNLRQRSAFENMSFVVKKLTAWNLFADDVLSSEQIAENIFVVWVVHRCKRRFKQIFINVVNPNVGHRLQLHVEFLVYMITHWTLEKNKGNQNYDDGKRLTSN